MIKAYLAGIASQYEAEDIEVRYSIYEDEELLSKEAIWLDYQKPAIVGLIALRTLLQKLEKHRGKEILIMINDAALNEIIRGTSTTKNIDVLQKARETRVELLRFGDCVIKDISGEREELVKWQEIFQP